jgi:hypothetical protein
MRPSRKNQTQIAFEKKNVKLNLKTEAAKRETLKRETLKRETLKH